jgi:hypothetical protein
MTKLDRAINNEKELKELEKFYQLHNISALDLFNILVEVRVHSQNIPVPPSSKHNYASLIHKISLLLQYYKLYVTGIQTLCQGEKKRCLNRKKDSYFSILIIRKDIAAMFCAIDWYKYTKMCERDTRFLTTRLK